MKKTLSIEPVISTFIGRPYGRGDDSVFDVGDDYFELEDDKQYSITRVGCRIDKLEPEIVYCMYHFLSAMKPGWKGDHQDGWSGITFLTCSCGHSGCNGYTDNVRIHRKKKTVRVMDKVSDGYAKGVVGTGSDVVYFEKGQWDGVREYYLDLFRKSPGGIFKDNDIFFTGRWGLAAWS